MYSTLIAIRSPKERYKSEFERLMTARLVVLQVHADAQEVLAKALGFRADSSDCVLSIWALELRGRRFSDLANQAQMDRVFGSFLLWLWLPEVRSQRPRRSCAA